ncbi:hypothetical protein AFCDBAGC_4863 [Methylobacterium cerastii]|uniref:Uncharacterized protein n=2 Tax=Methylobacterium TaxID=407 RepID=A0ABQ4QNX8_9HYPH|nr:hypothetical protein [Methylobacterium cerastii]GJD46978.1 hypothetical protein AFCDBAGC_4863 [Methylobacterium cerastii]
MPRFPIIPPIPAPIAALAALSLVAAALPALGAPADPIPPAAPPPPSPQPPPPASFPMARVVPKGEARTIAFFTSLFPDCSSQGPVVIRTLDQPRHGAIDVAPADSFPRYGVGSTLAACNARKVPGVKLTYTSEEGFEGVDTFRIFVINADGTGYESDVRVTVR